MFRKALLTLDRSPFSEAAIARVADVTQNEAIVVEVLDSVAEILGRGGPAFEVPRDTAEQLRSAERKDVERRLEQVAEQLRAAGMESRRSAASSARLSQGLRSSRRPPRRTAT